MICELLLVFSLVSLLVLKWKRRPFETLYKQMKKISARRLPFIGHIHMLMCSDEERIERVSMIGRETNDAGGVTGFWIANKLYSIISDPDVAENVLKTCLEKDDLIKCFHLATKDGSAFASVKIWRPRRKLVAPTFSMANLNRFAQKFSEHSRVLEEKMRELSGRGPVSLSKTYSMYSVDAISGSLGFQVNAQKNTDHPLPLAVQEVFNCVGARMYKPWLHSDFVFKLLPRYRSLLKHKSVLEIVDNAINEKRKLKENNQIDTKVSSNRHKTFIDLMLEADNISNVTIREECIIIMGAASDTSSITLSFASLLLAKYPDMQEKVYNELIQVLGEDGRPVTPEDLQHLKYMDAFVRETLRLYPPGPLIIRKIDKNIELPSGITLVPGCGAVIHIWAINRNPKYWGEDAEEFRPERFLETTSRTPAAFMTFSYGPRNCLGYKYAMISIKTVLATLLKRYRFLPASEDLKNKPFRLKYDIILRHADNNCVKIETRK